MDMNKSLHILRKLGLPYCDCADSVLTSVIAKVAQDLQQRDEKTLIELATTLLSVVDHAIFSPIWVSLLGQLAVHSERKEVSSILAHIAQRENECYKANKDWLPLSVLEQLFMVYLPSLEQRVLTMVDKIVCNSTTNATVEIIKNSHLITLSQREGHVYQCISCMLNTLMPYSAMIGEVKSCFTSLVNEIPNSHVPP